MTDKREWSKLDCERAAKRQGLILRKSRSRDPRALDYGAYVLVDERHGGGVYGATGAIRWAHATLDDIEAFLLGEPETQAKSATHG